MSDLVLSPQQLFPAVTKSLSHLSNSPLNRRSCQRKVAAMIWDSVDTSAFKEAAETCLKKCATCLDKTVTKYQLTPFLVAVMAGDTEKARILAELGADINGKDYAGNNGLHHAAMQGNRAMKEWLLTRGADTTQRNQFGGRYTDIESWTRLETPLTCTDEQCAATVHEVDAVARATFDQACIPRQGQIVGDYVFSAKELATEWEEANKPEHPLALISEHKDFKKAYRKFLAHSTGTAVKPSPMIPVDPTRPEEVQCGLFATRDYKPGEVIAEYYGAPIKRPTDLVPDMLSWDETQQWLIDNGHEDLIDQDSTYALKDIDGKTYRSGAATSNDGFPNAISESIRNTDGRPSRSVLIASSPIKAGEEVVWDYGFFYGGKAGAHVEIRRNALHMFAKENSFERIANSMASLLSPTDSYEKRIENVAALQNLIYIFSTPSAALDLIGQGLLTAKELEDLYMNTKIPAIVGGGWGRLSMITLQTVAKFIESVREHDPELATQAIDTLLQKFDLLSNRHEHYSQLKWIHDVELLFQELKEKGDVSDPAIRDQLLSTLSTRLEAIAKEKPEVSVMDVNMMTRDSQKNLIESSDRQPVWM